jgi:hypothetical protein
MRDSARDISSNRKVAQHRASRHQLLRRIYVRGHLEAAESPNRGFATRQDRSAAHYGLKQHATLCKRQIYGPFSLRRDRNSSLRSAGHDMRGWIMNGSGNTS